MSTDEIGAVIDAISDKDRVWFSHHPHRNFHVRGFVPGELPASFPAGDGVAIVVVRQIDPGVRMRVPIYLCSTPADTEAVARKIYEAVMGASA